MKLNMRTHVEEIIGNIDSLKQTKNGKDKRCDTCLTQLSMENCVECNRFYDDLWQPELKK